jgi:hypothetical protein
MAAGFLRCVLDQLASPLGSEVPAALECRAEEVVHNGRLDLRLRSGAWDVIVELKIHAGYGHGWFERYLDALSDGEHAYLVAITRDVPVTEPAPGAHPRWLGATRWQSLLPGMRLLRPTDERLADQWPLLIDVLEEEGSMGFTRPDPQLFDAFARGSRANRHMEDFLRVLETPLLQALQNVLGGPAQASLYWKRPGRFSRARWGKIDIPFRVPAGGPGRVRAGLIGWEPPVSFYVQPVPNQRWDLRKFSAEAQLAVDRLTSGDFEPKYMRAYLDLDDGLLASERLAEQILEWATERFADLRASGLLDLPVEALGDADIVEDEVTDPAV